MQTAAEAIAKKIRIRRTPMGLHQYTATLKGSGWYGWGDSPRAAREKLLEILAREAAAR